MSIHYQSIRQIFWAFLNEKSACMRAIQSVITFKPIELKRCGLHRWLGNLKSFNSVTNFSAVGLAIYETFIKTWVKILHWACSHESNACQQQNRVQWACSHASNSCPTAKQSALSMQSGVKCRPDLKSFPVMITKLSLATIWPKFDSLPFYNF